MEITEHIKINRLKYLVKSTSQIFTDLNYASIGSKGEAKSIAKLVNFYNELNDVLQNKEKHLELFQHKEQKEALLLEYADKKTQQEKELSKLNKLKEEKQNSFINLIDDTTAEMETELNNSLLKNEISLPSEYTENLDFIVGTFIESGSKDERHGLTIGEGVTKIDKYLPVMRSAYTLSLNGEIYSNIVIKTSTKIDSDFDKMYDSFIMRCLTLFPNSCQVAALNNSVNGDFSIMELVKDCNTGMVFFGNNNISSVAKESNDISEMIKKLDILSDSRQAMLRSKSFENILKYNKNNPDSPESIIFVAVKNYPEGFNEETRKTFLKLYKDSPKSGIYIILNISEDYIESLDTYDVKSIRKSVDELISKTSYSHIFDYLGHCKLKDSKNIEIDCNARVKDFSENKFFNALSKRYTENISAAILLDSVLYKTANPKDDVNRRNKYSTILNIPIGKEGGKISYLQLSSKDSPHVLVNGMSGSGKSVFLNTLILSACYHYSPKELEIDLFDFKSGAGFGKYKNALPHVKFIATEAGILVSDILEHLTKEIQNRSRIFGSHGGDISAYNEYATQNGLQTYSRKLIVIDEYQTVVSDDVIMEKLVEIAQKGRSAGVCLVMASQSLPSEVNLGGLKNNVKTRIAFKNSPSEVSRMISDDSGDMFEKRASELEALKGLCFFGRQKEGDSQSTVVKMRSAYCGEDEEMTRFIDSIRNRWNEYEIKQNIIDEPQEILLTRDVAMSNKKIAQLVNAWDNGHLFTELGVELISQEENEYRIDDKESGANGILYLFGNKDKAINIEMSILRSILYTNMTENVTAYCVDLSGRRQALQKGIFGDLETFIKQNPDSDIFSSIEFYSGLNGLAEVINGVYEIFEERDSLPPTEWYPIEIIINMCENIKEEKFEEYSKYTTLIQESAERNIYFVLHFEDTHDIKGYDSPYRIVSDAVVLSQNIKPKNADGNLFEDLGYTTNCDALDVIKDIDSDKMRQRLSANPLKYMLAFMVDSGKTKTIIPYAYQVGSGYIESLAENLSLKRRND